MSSKLDILFALCTIFVSLAVAAPSISDDRQKYDEASAHDILNVLRLEYMDAPSAPTGRNFSGLYAELQKYDWQHFNDAQLKRQFQIVLRYHNSTELQTVLQPHIDKLKTMATTGWACPYGPPSEKEQCNIPFMPDIKAVIGNVENLNEIHYYWREWREKMPQEMHDAFDAYRMAYYKFNATSSEIWYNMYDGANIIDLLETSWQTIAPFYRELHAHLVRRLRAKYGRDIVGADNLIPHYLVEMMTQQKPWKLDTIFTDPYPQTRLPNLQAELFASLNGPMDLIQAGLTFFDSMGFEKIPKAFIDRHIIEQSGPNSDCEAKIDDLGYSQIQQCPKLMNYKKLMQMHGHIAQVQYALKTQMKPIGLDREACPGFTNILEQATILSVSNSKHFQQQLHLLEHYNYDSKDNLNRLYNLALQTLLTLPTYLVHEHLWLDIIDTKIPPNFYNCHYWDLMGQYMGVGRETRLDVLDMPVKFYEGVLEETSSTKKLFGEFMGYRLYRDICKHIGEYEEGNPAKALDQCDWANHTVAGEILSNLMSAGSSKPWFEVMNDIPGAPRIESENPGIALMQYFQPVYDWLREDNRRLNVTVGWEYHKSCPLLNLVT